VAGSVNQASNELPSKGLWPLLSLNFFMAGMRTGIGPLLGVFRLGHGRVATVLASAQ